MMPAAMANAMTMPGDVFPAPESHSFSRAADAPRRDEPADPSGASRMREGGKPLAIGLVGAVTRQVEGEEDVLGLHWWAPAWPA